MNALKRMALGVALASAAGVAAAGSFTVTPMIGQQQFTDNEPGWEWEDGERFTLGLGYRFTPGLQAEISASNANGDRNNKGDEGDARYYDLSMLYRFNAGGTVQPFVLGGSGKAKYEYKGGRDLDAKFAQVGLGAFFKLSEQVNARAEYRAHYVTSGLNWFEQAVLLGLEFNFGGTATEAAPAQESTQEPTPVEEPVPVTPVDSDADGVADDMDKCPNTAAGTPVDADGCPLDSDADGVADYLDKCPNTPAGTKVDAMGCTLIPDADKDGVADAKDQCPNTKPGVAVDTKGCAVLVEEKVSFTLNVTFPAGKTILNAASKDEVKKLAEFLKEYPSTYVNIEGHTDSSGNAAANKRLSTQRANAVRESLIKDFGVAADRVTAEGFGSAKPITDNKTAEGRAQNRRVVAEVTATKKMEKLKTKK